MESATTIVNNDDHTDTKSDQLSIDEFKPDESVYENPALVLDQLLPIDMSSPTLLINQTPTSETHVADHSDYTAIDRVLDELDVSSSNYSYQLDNAVKPELDAQGLEDVNPFSDGANDTSSVFSVSETDAQLTPPCFSGMEVDLFPLLETPKLDHTPENPYENDNIILAELDTFPKSDLVTEHGTFHIPAAESPKPELKPESPRENDDKTIANSNPFQNSTEVELSGDVNMSNLECPDTSNFNAGSDSPKYVQDSFGNRVLVDTSAPIDSVKDAVSKFGGIVDWKAHKVQTGERRRFIEEELDKAQEEVPIFRKMFDKSEEEKSKILQELEAGKRLIEDMKLNVERAQTEEHQARQDSELVKLRVDELEQGIAEESSVAAKAQLEVAKARQAAAVSDLQSAIEELQSLKTEYTGLISEKDLATKGAEQAMDEAKEVEKTVQDLTIELISAKESLESAHAVHLEAEERRVTAAIDKEQSVEKWGKELQEVEDEVRLLDEQVTNLNDLRSKLHTSTLLLEELKAELPNYMESKSIDNVDGLDESAANQKSLRRTHTGIQASVASAKTELDDIRANIQKAIEEVETLKVTSSTLQSELESKKMEVEKFNHIKSGTKAESAKALESELNKIELELELAKTRFKETETIQKTMDLTMQLPQAAQDTERLKLEAEETRNEHNRVKEETEQVKAEAIRIESRVLAAEKETEGAKASEKLALGAIRALRESDDTEEPSSSEVTVSVEEYYELGKRAHDAEEDANARKAVAEAQVEEAKEEQLRIMEKLEEVDQEMGQRREELNMALKRAEEATEGKLRFEEELRQWRSRSEEEKISSESKTETKHESSNYIRLPTAHYTAPPEAAATVAEGEKATKKKKKSFFPRILMFMARRKTHSSKH